MWTSGAIPGVRDRRPSYIINCVQYADVWDQFGIHTRMVPRRMGTGLSESTQDWMGVDTRALASLGPGSGRWRLGCPLDGSVGTRTFRLAPGRFGWHHDVSGRLECGRSTLEPARTGSSGTGTGSNRIECHWSRLEQHRVAPERDRTSSSTTRTGLNRIEWLRAEILSEQIRTGSVTLEPDTIASNAIGSEGTTF